MSISLSCFPSQLGQNNILSDRQSYLNDSLIGQVYDFSKDINQMESMITSMEEMSKDIRLHLLDLQTMPGVTNSSSHLQQQTQHFESVVEDQLRSSLQRLSPVIMQSNHCSGSQPYSASQWRHQTPSTELHSAVMGGNSHERSDYEFSTPPDLTGEPESRKQFQTNTAMCRRRLQFERDSEGKVGFGNISPFTEENHSYTNQMTVPDELDGSHFTACLDQGLKKSPKEKSSDASVKRHSQTQTSMAPEQTENTKAIGSEMTSGEKSQESTTFEDSNTNVNLKDLVSQAAKLLDSNGADLGIDTDSMVDSMLSEIRAAFNQNVEKVLKNVNVSELLSKQPQEASYNKMPSAKKTCFNVSNCDSNDSDVSFCDENPEEHEMCSKDMCDVGHCYHDDCDCPPPVASTCVGTNFDASTWKGSEAKKAWGEEKADKILWGNNRRRKKKTEEEEEDDDSEVEEEVFCPYISGGVRPHRSNSADQPQFKKNCRCDQEKNDHHHQKCKGTTFEDSEDIHYPLLSDTNDLNNAAKWTEKTPGQQESLKYLANKSHSKHKRCILRKSNGDKKSRGVHFSDTVYLIEDNDGDVVESEIFMPQGKFNCQSRNHYGKCSSHGGHVDLKKHQKHVNTNQDRVARNKSVMTACDVHKPNSATSSIATRTKDYWSDSSSPRTRTENWKCNSRVDDEQNGIFKSLTIESVSTDRTMPSDQWAMSSNSTGCKGHQFSENRTEQNQGAEHTKRHGNDLKKDSSQRNKSSGYNIAGGCGPDIWDNYKKENFVHPESNLTYPGNTSESQMAFVCCILPQSISKNTDTSENVYISNMMLTDLKGEDLKNPQKIGQPIEPSEAKKVSYLVRELMEHLHANENFLNKDYPTNKKMAAETGSSPPGRRMSWVDAVNTEKSSSARLSQCGSPILFCYLPPEFLPKAHQVKSLKKPSKEPRKTMDTPSARDKDVRKSASSHKGCQTETSNKTLNNGYRPIDNQGGMSWWISAPPRVKKKSTSRIQQIYSNRLPPPVPLVTVKNVGKDLCSSPPERKVKALLSPYNKKPKLGLNSSPLKKKPFLI